MIKHLPRTQQCVLFEIGSPMWMGSEKKRVVGLNASRVQDHNEIHFTYVRKSDGKLSIPDHYYFDGKKRYQKTYPTQDRGGLTLLLVPFSDLQVLVRDSDTIVSSEQNNKTEKSSELSQTSLAFDGGVFKPPRHQMEPRR